MAKDWSGDKTSPLAMGRNQRGSLANKKKKKEQKTGSGGGSQSSSVTQQQRINQKMYGQPTKPTYNNRSRNTTTQRRASNTTAAQRQKMGMPTSEDLSNARTSRRRLATNTRNFFRDAMSEDSRSFAQRQKSGTLTAEDEGRVQKMHERRTDIVKNTGAAAKKAVLDTGSGYAQSLYDVTELTASNKNGTRAMAMKMGIDPNKDKSRMAELERQRKYTAEESKRRRDALFNKQEQRQAEWDERTKNAKGLEKAWYGAVESGTGMLADTAVGALTGTGQFGALASMGLRTYGSSANQARKEGATDSEARMYGLLQSGKEMGTELMFQGAGLAKAAYGGKAGLSLADKSANVLTRGLTGVKADIVGAGVRALGGTAEENAEELAGWMADPLIKELTYGKNVRNRMRENLRSNIPQIGSGADAAHVASYFSTPQFTDELTNEYVKSGMSKDKAAELADEMRDYYLAYYSNDTERLDELEDDLAAKLSGQDKLSFKSWSMDELKDTFASTTLLTLATGIPGAATTSVKGNQIFDSDEVKAVFGNDAVRKVADAVRNSSNGEMSLKADTMKDRLDSGKDLTGTQKYDLYQGYIEKVRDTEKKAAASYGVVENARKEQDLVPTVGVDRNGNRVFAKETGKAYNEKYASTELTVEAIKNYMESDNSISDDESRRADAVKKAVADIHVGGLTVGDAHEFAYGNELAREALKAEEGIDLDQYVVLNDDGTVNLPATNEATENALFQINADNAIQTAKAETEVFIDDTRGDIDKDLLSRFGNNGQAVWKEVNKDLDPRDLNKYLTNANAASYFYSAGRNTDMSVDEAVNSYADTFKSVDKSVLKRAFAAGARDRIIANTPGYGQTVKAGSNISLKKTKPILTGQLIMDKDVNISDSDQSAYLALAMATNTNIHIVSSLKSKNGVEINGMSHGNDIYLNMNAAAESNLGYVFMHEMTHQIKQYAPNEYLALENLVRDRWFNKDQKGMEKAIKDRIALYSEKGGQQLTEEEAVEEIIADAMAEAMDDPDFATQVCEENLDLGQAILNSIKAALRSIRQMFANTEFRNDRFHNSLLSYLGILDDAEKMWLNALHTARQNKANGLIADWQDRANNNVASQSTSDSNSGNIMSREDIRMSLSESFPEYKEDKTNLDIAVDAISNLYDQQLSWIDYLEGEQNGETEGEKQASKQLPIGQLTWDDLDWSEEAAEGSEDRQVPSMRRNKNNNSGIRTVGRRLPIPEELIQKGYVDLRGHKVSKPEDLARLCQVLRNPMFETSRIFYLKGDTIVGHRAVSSRLPMQSAGTYSKSAKYWSEEAAYQKDVMNRLGADGYYIMHNHPSGHVAASNADKGITKAFQKYVPGLKGHIILDHDKFGWITPGGRSSERAIPGIAGEDPNFIPSVENDHLGIKWGGKPDDIAAIGRDILQSKDGHSVVVYMTSHLEINELQEINNKVILNDKNFANYIKNENTRAGSGRALIYTTDPMVRKTAESMVKTKHFEGVVYERDPGVVIFSAGKNIAAWGTTIPQKKTYIDGGTKAADSRAWYQENQVKFSISEPVERVADLIAVHNLKPEDIRNTFELGGFPMPSIAITKDSMGHDMYGDISLLFGSDTIDPKFFRSNQVFGGDAYTPTFPATQYKPNEDIVEKFRDIYYDNAKTLGYDAMRPFYELAEDAENALNRNGGEQGLIDRYKNDIRAMRTFLKINGKDVEDVVKRTEDTISETEQKLRQHFIDTLGEDAIREFEGESIPHGKAMMDHRKNWTYDHSDEIKNAYKDFLNREFSFSDEEISNVLDNMSLFETMKLVRNALNYLNNGPTTVKEEVDRAATDKAIEDAAHELGYEEWIDGLLTGIEEKRGIRNDKEFFTRNGNRRSWDTLHDDITLENVVKAMRSELAAGGNGFLWKNPKGAAQKQYKSLDEMRADEDRLQQLPEEEYKALEQAATQKLSDVLSDVVDNNPGRFMNSFGAVLDTGEYIAEILNETRDKATMQRKLKKDYSLDVSDEQMDRIAEAIDEIANIPTGYFEAKPRRAVGFDEVKAAIIPQTMDEDIKAGLESRGIPYYEYDPEVDGDRKKVVNQAATEKNLRFSISEDAHVMYTPKGVEVVQNPTDSEYNSMREEILAEYPWLRGTGEPLLRKTYDESGNEYYWNAFEAMHSQVEPYINKEYNTRTSQQWKWYEKPDKDDYPIDYSKQGYRFSITDSEGNRLSEGQIEFFRDSKMLDEEGRLKPMYHGTQNEFFEFDITKAYPGTLGRGFYFSDSDSHAGVYGKTNKYYLNLVNPLMSGTNNITKDQLHRFVSELAEDEDYGLENYGYGATVDSVVDSVWGKSDFAMLRDLNLTAVGDFAEALKVFNRVNGTDYDGIITDTETIAFYPQQIKSVDNLNPTLSKDTRYSITDSDGKELTDGQMEYFKNSQARDDQGRLMPLYHGTQNGGFTIFDSRYGISSRYFFFVDSMSAAKGYSGSEKTFSESVAGEEDMRLNYKVYLDMVNPLIVDAQGNSWVNIPYEDDFVTTNWLAEYAESEGYDGVIVKNVIDRGSADTEYAPQTDYIVFSSNQIKDTRNENPTENPDIRYSITPEDEAMSKMANDFAYDNSYERLAYYETILDESASEEAVYEKAKKYIAEDVDEFYAGLTRYADGMKFDDPVLEAGRVRMAKSKQDFFNSSIAKWNQNWLTNGEVLDIDSVKKPIKDLVMANMMESKTSKRYKADLVKKMAIDMRLAYFYAKQGRTDIADALLWHSAFRMVDGVEFYADDENFETYKRLRDYFRNTNIQLGEEYWSDTDYGAFRKANYGRINLVRGKTNLDKVLDDLYHENPDGSIEGIAVEWFSPEAFEKNDHKIDSVPDILLQIADVLDDVEPYAEAYSSDYCAEWATDLASSLLDIMANGKELQSTADKYKNKYEAKIKDMKARHAEAMLKVRQQRDQAVRRERVRLKEYVEKKKEQQAHKTYFDRIKETHDNLVERLSSNTADKHIPEQYKKSLAKLLAAFDLQTVGSKARQARTGHVAKNTIRLAAIREALKNIEDRTELFHVNDAITDLMDELSSVEGKTIDALSAAELWNIDRLLKSLLHEFNRYEKVRIGAKNLQAADLADAQVYSALEHAELFGPGNDYYGVRGWMDKIVNMDEMTPAYLFKMIDPDNVGLGLMWKEIRRSQDKYIRNTDQINKWVEEITGKYKNKGRFGKKYGSDEIEKWRSSNYIRTFELENGTVELTPAQMMSLYCLSKRNQAYGHMVGAGIVVAPVSFQAKMMTDLKKKINRSLPVILTDADIKTVVSQLTPEQVQVADQLQELMSTKMADLGNEASMNVLGIKLFNESDYFPIKSDKAALEKDLTNEQFENAIRNFGFAKAVKPGARNAIMIEDIFDVVTEHCNNMNLYNSYSETLNDFMKVFNKHSIQENGADYSVRQALAHAYSQKATTFIMEFIRDLNGNVSRGRTTGIENAMNDMLARAKQASVFANLRVLVQQPTAITRAFAVIDPKYLKGVSLGDALKGMVPTVTTEAMQEMFDHCPIALWKSWGYYDINMGKSIESIIMNEGNWLEDVATQAYGKADNITWTAIWQMVKAETKDLHPELKEGTEEFWEHCNERMSEVVDLTQVVDSPLHRSHAMRAKDVFHKTFTAFMAEPTLTFNMIRDGYIRGREEWKKGNKKKAAEIYGRTASVAVLQATTVAAAAAVIDALRGKNPGGDDDEDKNLWLVNFLNNLKDEMKIWNKIYYLKDLASIAEGWDNANLALQGWKTLTDGFRQYDKKLFEGSKVPWWKIYYNLLGGIGYFTGIPFKTLMKDGRAIFELLGGQLPESLVGEEKSESVISSDSKLQSLRLFGGNNTNKSSSSTTVVKVDTGEKWYDYENNPITVRDGSPLDKLLNRFGVNLTAAEKAAIAKEQEHKEREDKAQEIADKYADLSGEEKDKKVWGSVTSYLKDKNDGRGIADMVASAEYGTINEYKRMYLEAGGNAEYFDSRIFDLSKAAMKKSIMYDATDKQIEQQEHIKEYLLSNGMDEAELSEIVYKSDMAKDMKVAFRLGDKELMIETLRPLINAGLSYDDFVRLWDNRNRIQLSSYKGRYKDKLKSTGNFIWPTDGVITSHFGYRDAPTAGASSNHPAIDIGAPQGTAVVAADGGVVISAGANGGYGNSVGIRHDNGMITWYNHLYSWNVKEGDTVAQGQQIAQVGSTGISTGPHLDFKIMNADGEPVDPEKYLAAR